MGKVLYISSSSGADFFNGMGRALGKAFSEIGVQLYAVKADAPDFATETLRLVKEYSFDFALSFAGLGKSIRTPDGVPFWQEVSLPHIAFYGDSPSYFFDLHVDHSAWDISLYEFGEHLAFREMFSILQGFHGVMPPMPVASLIDGPLDWRAKENGKLIFLKSAHNPQTVFDSWQHLFTPGVAKALMEIGDDMSRHLDQCSHRDIVARILSYMKNLRLHAGGEKLLLLMVAQLDHYLRAVKAALLADAALDFPVEIHGLNWGHVRTENRRGSVIESADYSRSESLMRNALATLDMSPNVSAGLHDRIRRSACHETFCLTNSSQDLGIELLAGEGMTYRFDRAAIGERIDGLLSHPKQTVELGVEFGRQVRQLTDAGTSYACLKQLADFVRQNNADSRPEGLHDAFTWPPEHTVKSTSHKPLFDQDLNAIRTRINVLDAWVRPGQAQQPAPEPQGFLHKLFSGK